jgi:hypothetical protein
MRLLNPLVRRVLSSRHLGSRIDQMMLLEFTGRRSGRRIRVPVALHLIDGVPMAFTHRPWRLNFTGGAPVTITHRGQVRQGRGVLLPATPEQVGSAYGRAGQRNIPVRPRPQDRAFPRTDHPGPGDRGSLPDPIRPRNHVNRLPCGGHPRRLS